MTSDTNAQEEPWLRGTWTEVAAVGRGVLHSLEMADEDVKKWCGGLTAAELNARPHALPSVAFHLRHIARSLHRLLTYAEGETLSEAQLTAIKSEMSPDAEPGSLFAEYVAALEATARRVRGLARLDPGLARTVGRKALPTTIGGLLVHIAEHTQRHVGQAVTTAKVVMAMREG